MAITWRNVDAPSMGDAIRAGALAQQSFNSGFDNLNRVLQERQAANQTALDRSNEAAKQNFLNTLYGARTVEDLNALQSSGQLAKMMQGLTPEAQAEVRGADERRLGELRTLIQQEQQFTDAQKARDAKPIVDRLMSLANSSDLEARASAQNALNVYAEQGMVPNAGELMGKLVGADRGFVEHGFKVNEDRRSQTRLEDQLKTSAVSRAEAGLRQQLTKAQIDQANRDREAQTLLSQAYLNSRGNTMLEGGLPNERAMAGAADQLVVGRDPAVAARVLQEAAKSDAARVEAWRATEDANGYVGTSPLNSTSVINAIAPEINKITVGSKGEVAASINEEIRRGYTIPKGTRLGDGTIVPETMTLPYTLNIAKAALAESDTTFGLDRGGDAVSIMQKYMLRPEVIRDILTRQAAEKLRAGLQSNPTISPGPTKR